MSLENFIEDPSPLDFDIFVPWACGRFQVDKDVYIIKSTQDQYSTDADRGKTKASAKPKRIAETTQSVEQEPQSSEDHSLGFSSDVICVTCVYDLKSNLVELKFAKNTILSREVFKVMAFALPFHKCLTGITIRSGLNNLMLYELQNIIEISTITDICLDDAAVVNGNYHLLLSYSTVRQLSLCRCQIDDETLRQIANMLIYPLNASTSLYVLNLGSNFITNVGAAYLADVLRSNRCLTILNLSDNQIYDEGATAIFKSLMCFPMTYDEVLNSRSRFVEFVKAQIVSPKSKGLKASDFDKRSSTKTRKKTLKSLQSSTGKDDKSEETEFTDPFSAQETFTINNIEYSYGNNRLAHINVSYNNLTILSAKTLLDVVTYQSECNRTPLGLIRVNLDGNCLPAICYELIQIDIILGKVLDKLTAPPPKKKGPVSRK